MERELAQIEKRLRMYQERKQRITDVYAAGNLGKDEYVTKSRAYDNEINMLATRQISLKAQVPFFRNTKLIETAVQQYCEAARVRYEKCVNFETKRQFLLDYIGKVVYWNDKTALCGSVPIVVRVNDRDETQRLEFKIEIKATTMTPN